MIGERIKSARLALGYSAEQVASHLNVSPATIYRYENGDISKLSSKIIKPLADYLCISPSYLMGWSDEKTPPRLDLLINTEGDSKITRIVTIYHSLSPRGQDYLLDAAEFAESKYGKKPEDTSAQSV